jgi:SET domain-containing protein
MALASGKKAATKAKAKSLPKPYRVGRAQTGLGLFAAQHIPERKLIIEYTGPRIPTRLAQEIDRRRANKYLFEIDYRWTIDGSTRTNLARYVNHSCDPNAEAESNRGRLMYRAIKPIEAGEEITLDYGEEHMELYFGKAGCLCPGCADMVKTRKHKKSKTSKKRKR